MTSIIGTNSVTINVGNGDEDTGNTNIVGALIANIKTPSPLEGDGWGEGFYDGGNLTLNTKTLTYSDLKNFSVSENNQFGMNLSIGFNSEDPTAPQNSQSANNIAGVLPGKLKLDLAMQGSESSSITKATIGQGNITTNSTITYDSNGDAIDQTGGTINDATILAGLNRDITNSEQNKKSIITSDFEATLTIDTRLLAAAYYGVSGTVTGDEESSQKAQNNLNSYFGDVKKGIEEGKKDLKFVGKGLKTIREIAEDNLGITGTILTQPTSLIEGTIFTFLEENSPNGSYLINKNGIINDPTKTKNYAVNGIMTTNDTAFINYISDPKNDVTLRYNPTHGFLGDLVESGIGKFSIAINAPEVVAMNNYVAQDLYQRNDIANSTNTFHSQGTIIGIGAMQLYANTYQLGFDTQGNTLPKWQNTQMDQSQKFVAVGPAVLEVDWYNSTLVLGEKIKENANWKHDPQDPILHLTAPSNLITDVAGLFTNKPINSSLYIPNLFIDIPLGLWNGIFHMENHDVKNPIYSQFLKGSQEQNSQNPSTAPLPNN